MNINNKKDNNYIFDHMVYIRLFEGCNLNCEHCFIPSNPKKINSSYYENNGLVKDLENNVNLKENQKIYLQWHGGEPTLFGYEYIEHAIKNTVNNPKYTYVNGIQTNLINYHIDTEKWNDLYKNYFNNKIGISWDYKIRHLKEKNLSEVQNYEKFEELFWNNVSLALNNKIDLYMVVTVTKLFFENFKNPFVFFDFITNKGIEKLNFERITKTGFARETWEKLGLTNKEYSFYMSKFYKAYKLYKQNNPDIKLNISPFDGLEDSVIEYFNENKNINQNPNYWDIMSFKNQGYGCWSGECDTRFHTIDSNGYKKGCTALNSEHDNKNQSLKEVNSKIIWINNLKNKDYKEQRQERQLSCQGCEFINICSSGCLTVEKFDESLECSGAKELFKTIKEYNI